MGGDPHARRPARTARDRPLPQGRPGAGRAASATSRWRCGSNRPAFDYIRDNSLYSVEGQQWFFYNRQPIAFRRAPSRSRRCGGRSARRTRLATSGTEFRDAKTKRRSLWADGSAHCRRRSCRTGSGRPSSMSTIPIVPAFSTKAGSLPSRDSAACPASELDCNRVPRPASVSKVRAGRTIACAAPRSTTSMLTAIR